MRLPRWLDPRRIYQQPGRILNPTGVRGGVLAGTAIGEIGKRFGIDPETLSNLEMIVTTPGVYGLLLSLGGSSAQGDDKWRRLGYKSKDDYDFAVEKAARENLDLTGRGDMDAGPDKPAVVLPEVEVTQIEFGREDPFAPVDYNSSRGPQALETGVKPSREPPTSGSSNVQAAKDDLISSAQKIRNEYDRLRQEDPEAAVAYGRQKHKELFPLLY